MKVDASFKWSQWPRNLEEAASSGMFVLKSNFASRRPLGRPLKLTKAEEPLGGFPSTFVLVSRFSSRRRRRQQGIEPRSSTSHELGRTAITDTRNSGLTLRLTRPICSFTTNGSSVAVASCLPFFLHEEKKKISTSCDCLVGRVMARKQCDCNE